MKNIVFLICIIILGAFLRFNNLNSVPPSASLDEASIGYNAYSILKTRADEYGTTFPILLRSFDDWRPALYAYLVIPFIKLFGLNIIAVRLPSVIFSILTVIATYFLVCELFRKWEVRGRKLDKEVGSQKDNLNSHIGNLSSQIALLTSLLLAISPWHIYISRLGHEVNAGLFFSVCAILFFLKAINSRKNFLILSSIFFALSLHTYQSEKVFVPLIVLILALIYRKSLLKIKKELLASIVIGIIIITPVTLATFSPEGLVRFKGTSAFKEESFYKKSADEILKFKSEGNMFGEIINNRRLVPFKIFATNYISHFNPKFLFLNTRDESFKAPNFGLMYIWELPFLLIGIVYLLRILDIKIKLLLILWLLTAFIAPSLATGAPHAMRSFNVLPIPQIITTLGLLTFIAFIKKGGLKNFIKIFYLFMGIIVVYFLANFYKEYFYSFPKNQSSSFQYSLHSAIKFVMSNEKYYDKIIFSNKDNLYQSYMFYLFDSKYDPYLYQKQGGTKSGGFAETHFFSKYEFRPIVWSKDKYFKKTLFLGNANEFESQLSYLASFTNLDGKGEIKVVKN